MGSKDLFDRPRQEHSHMVEEDGPIRPWRPRRVLAEAEDIEEDQRLHPDPTSLDSLPEDSGAVELPEPPPPAPGDDLRLPNPDRWATDAGLPIWFWIIAAVMVVAGTLAIVWDQPEYVEPKIPGNIGQQ